MLADHICLIVVYILEQLACLLGSDLVKTEDVEAVFAKPLFTSEVKTLYLLFGLDQVLGEAVVVYYAGAVDLAKVFFYSNHSFVSGMRTPG